MKAFKVFNSDFTCRNFMYKVGKIYTHKGEIGLCNEGFHACVELVDCFNYRSFNPENKVAEVKCSGKIIGDDDKLVCSEITIIKELGWHTVLDLCNTGTLNSGYRNSGNRNSGDRNSGYWNSGDWNSGNWNLGDRNSGDRNSGNWNSGDRNSGNWNSGNWNSGYRNSGNWNSGNRNSGNWNSGNNESGYFNSESPDTIRTFNQLCKHSDWNKADKPDFLYFSLTQWVSESNMTEEEKEQHANYKVLGGYLKTLNYKEAFKLSWGRASNEDKKKIEDLPNFDWKVFTEISGIEKPETEEGGE